MTAATLPSPPHMSELLRPKLTHAEALLDPGQQLFGVLGPGLSVEQR